MSSKLRSRSKIYIRHICWTVCRADLEILVTRIVVSACIMIQVITQSKVPALLLPGPYTAQVWDLANPRPSQPSFPYEAFLSWPPGPGATEAASPGWGPQLQALEKDSLNPCTFPNTCACSPRVYSARTQGRLLKLLRTNRRGLHDRIRLRS